MERNGPIDRRVDSIINNNTFDVRQDFRTTDFSDRIPNTDDCRFVESVVEAIFHLEPRNNSLDVDVSAKLRDPILVWASGFRNNIDLTYYGAVMKLPHPIPGFSGVSKAYIAPPKAGNPQRFVVEIKSCVGASQRNFSNLLDEPRDRRRSQSRRRDDHALVPLRRRSPSPMPRSRSRSLSPPRRSSRLRDPRDNSPSRDRSPPRRHRRQSSSDNYDDSSSDEGVISRVATKIFAPFLS